MAKTKTMVLLFGFSFPLSLPASKKKVVLVSGKSGFSFWFQFCPREGVGVFSLPLNLVTRNTDQRGQKFSKAQ